WSAGQNDDAGNAMASGRKSVSHGEPPLCEHPLGWKSISTAQHVPPNPHRTVRKTGLRAWHLCEPALTIADDPVDLSDSIVSKLFIRLRRPKMSIPSPTLRFSESSISLLNPTGRPKTLSRAEARNRLPTARPVTCSPRSDETNGLPLALL